VTRNEALALRVEQIGIQFPKFEMQHTTKCVNDFLSTLSHAISDDLGWTVLPTKGCLDLFNFTKMVMYRDLDAKTWPDGCDPLEHPLLNLMFDPGPDVSHEPLFREDDLDDRVDLRVRYSVMDADPSQMAVIEDVLSGRNLVVEGPPGTGKSQTIVNLIAELLPDGKRVLFVSEKRAALEVVKSRLDKVGLGEFCLELHSTKANRKDFIEQIRLTKSLEPRLSGAREGTVHNLIEQRAKLNKYAAALRTPYGKIGFTVFELFEIHEKATVHFGTRSLRTSDLGFQIDEVRSWSKQDWKAAISALQDLADLYPGQLQDSPWYGCNPSHSDPHLAESLRSSLSNCLDAEKRLGAILDQWLELGIQRPVSVNELQRTMEAVDLLSDTDKLIRMPPDPLLRDVGNFSEQDFQTTLENIVKSKELSNELSAILKPSVFDLETADVRSLCEHISSRKFQ